MRKRLQITVSFLLLCSSLFAQPRWFWAQLPAADTTGSIAIALPNGNGVWSDSLRWWQGQLRIGQDTAATREYARSVSVNTNMFNQDLELDGNHDHSLNGYTLRFGRTGTGDATPVLFIDGDPADYGIAIGDDDLNDNNGKVRLKVGFDDSRKAGIYISDNFAVNADNAALSVARGQSDGPAVKILKTGVSNFSTNAGNAALSVEGGSTSTNHGHIHVNDQVINYDASTQSRFGYTYNSYVQSTNTRSTLNNSYGFYSRYQLVGSDASTINNLFDFVVANGTQATNASIGNRYGIYIAYSDAGQYTNAYGVYQLSSTVRNYFAGNIGLGDNTPSYSIDIANTDAIKLASGTTAQRPTGVFALIRGNSDDTAVEGHDGSEWKTFVWHNDANLDVGNYSYNIDQTVGSAQDDYIQGYNDSSGEIELRPSSLSTRGQLVETASESMSTGATFTRFTGLSSRNLSNFSATDSTLTYTGSEDVLVEISYSGNVFFDIGSLGTYRVVVKPYVNGGSYNEAISDIQVSTDGAEDWLQHISGTTWATLSTNDVISLRYTATAGGTYSLFYLSLTVKAL